MARVRPGLAALVALVLLALPAPAAATRSCSSATATSGSPRPTALERRLTAGGGYASPSMADDGTIVALRGGSFVRLRGDGGVVGAPIAAVGGDWIVARGPVRRAGLAGRHADRVLVHRPPPLLPAAASPAARSQDSEVAAYAYAEPRHRPARARRRARLPRAVVARLGPRAAVPPRRRDGERSRSTASARGEAERQGWFSYDDGTELGQGQMSRGGDKFAALAGDRRDPSLRRGAAAAGPAGAALHRAAAGRSPRRRGRPTADARVAGRADGVHVAGPVPDLRAPVPDCSA